MSYRNWLARDNKSTWDPLHLSYDRFPFDDDGNEKYISLLKESMTEDQVFNRYLEIIKELEKESQK